MAFMIKLLNNLGTGGNYLNIIKIIYGKLRANIVLKGERQKSFPLRSGKRGEGPLLLLQSQETRDRRDTRAICLNGMWGAIGFKGNFKRNSSFVR